MQKIYAINCFSPIKIFSSCNDDINMIIDHKMLFDTLFKFSDSHHTVEMRVERSVVHNQLLQLFDLETRCCVVTA